MKLNQSFLTIILKICIAAFFICGCSNDNSNITEPDPESSGPWIKKADMHYGRHSFATSVVDDKIYAFGGRYTEEKVTEYDPETDTWATKSYMPNLRAIPASAAVNGKIYVMGGIEHAFDPAQPTVDEYNPITDSWKPKASMSRGRLGLSVSVVESKIYAIGGMTSGGNFWSGMQDEVEVYEPVTDSWTIKSPIPTPRVWLSTSVVDGKIYAIGGALVTKTPVATVEMYDPVTDTWTTKSPMPTARTALATVVVDGLIYAIGGGTVSIAPGGFNLVEVYDPASDTWSLEADLPARRSSLSANVVNGNIYAIGGIRTLADPHLKGESTVYEYSYSSLKSSGY